MISAIWKIIICSIVLTISLPVYAFNLSHAGKYAFTYQDAYATDDRFSLSYSNHGNWWLKRTDSKNRLKIRGCEEGCELTISGKNDVKYFMKGFDFDSDVECINNNSFAICSVNVDDRPDRAYLFLDLTQYPLQLSYLKRLDMDKNSKIKMESPDLDDAPIVSYYMDLGVWFGGDNVAINPDGDDYDAGSGAVIGAGMSYYLSKDANFKHNNTIALRHQGAKSGKGENQGFVFESSVVKEWSNIGVGAGIHYDFENEVSDTDGNKTFFNNSLGTIVFVEWIAEERLKIIFKYLFMDYETVDGVPYDGNQYGIFMTLGFGG